MLLLQQMIVLFAYMLIGYTICKMGKIDEAAGSKISWLVLNVTNPMMVLSSVVNGNGVIEGKTLIVTAVLAVLLFVGLIIVAQVIIPPVFGLKGLEKGDFRLMTVFNNVGFMGFPLISATYGSEALLYGAIFLLPYNVLMYTYGINVVGKNEKKKIEWKKVMNLGVIACILAVIIYLTGIEVPQFVKSITQGFSNLTAPLSMLVIGISLTKIRLKELFLDVKLLIFAGIKLLVIPVIGMLIIRQFISIENLLGVSMVMLATPCGAMNAMIAEQNGGNYESVSKGVALTTLLSVVTIPLVSMIVM